MTTLSEWINRLLNTIRPRRDDADLQDELRFHVQAAIEEELKRGKSLADARRAVTIRLGGPAEALDALRYQRELPWVPDAIQDLRHASRSLRRAPGFALITVVTLGLGVAATATVFSTVDALLVRPLSVQTPEDLFVIRRASEPRSRFPLEFHQALSDSHVAFDESLASFTFPVTVVASSAGIAANAAFVTPDYFRVLGVEPTVGRFFQTGHADILVVSHRFWKERLGGRTDVVGEAAQIGKGSFIIGGVAPPGFGGLQLDVPVDLWIPIAAAPRAVPLPSFRPAVDIVGRLSNGTSPEAASSQLNIAHGRWAESVSSSRTTPALRLVSASHGLESRVREQFREVLGLLLGICGCLWTITIVNVSGLLGARLSERSREIGVRRALGATSWRLCVQLFAEIIVLVTGGLVLGVLAAAGLSAALPRWIPSWAGVDIHISPLVLAASATTATIAALIVTFVLAIWMRRHTPMSHSSPGIVQVGSGQRGRLSTCLVAAQLALTLPLIVVAGLLAQTLYSLGAVDTGFERSTLLQVRVEPALVAYAEERARAYYSALIERLRALPGVVNAALSSGGALSGYEGVATVLGNDGPFETATNAVDERYFSTLGIRLASGRVFHPHEARDNAAVVVVNAALARRLFGQVGGAVGQNVTLAQSPPDERRVVVIGVVENTADTSIRDRTVPTAYLPIAKSSLLLVHVRFAEDPVGVTAAVRESVASLDPSVPLLGIENMEERRHNALQRERLLAAIAGTVSWVALLLSAVGIFGRVNRDVVARRREVMIRTALGATPVHVAHLFLNGTARLVVFGVTVGIAVAAASAHAIDGQLYGISGTDPMTYAAAAATLALTAAIATILPLRPAWRAERTAQLLRE